MMESESHSPLGGGMDYYQILDIPRSANDKQIGAAYKTLLLKHHPDRNPGNEESARLYKQVCDAYNVLIDPNKRRAYDIGGIRAVEASENASSSSGNSAAGGDGKPGVLGKVFGNVMSALGVPGAAGSGSAASGQSSSNMAHLLNGVSEEFIDIAQRICRSTGLEFEMAQQQSPSSPTAPPTSPPPPSQPPQQPQPQSQQSQGATQPQQYTYQYNDQAIKVPDLLWGDGVDTKVDRHAGAYYRVTVDKTHVDGGFTLSIKSRHRDKFRVVLFDHEGSIVYQDECIRSLDNRSTAIRFFFTRFPTYNYLPLDAAATTLPLDSPAASSSDDAPAAADSNANNNNSGSLPPLVTPPPVAGASPVPTAHKTSMLSLNTANKEPTNLAIVDTAVVRMLNKLEGFSYANKELRAGRYLLGIYGDNSFLGKSAVSVLLVSATKDTAVINRMIAQDTALIDDKAALHALAAEYAAAKAHFEAIVQRIQDGNTAIAEKLEERDNAYKQFLKQSVSNSIDTTTTTLSPGQTDEEGHRRGSTLQAINDTLKGSVSTVSSAGGKAMTATVSATASVTAATAKAAGAATVATATTVGNSTLAAGGWLASKLKSSVSTLKTAVVPGAGNSSSSTSTSSSAEATEDGSNPTAGNTSNNLLATDEDTSKGDTIV